MISAGSATPAPQGEWCERLKRTVAELQRVTTIAFRSHAAYLEAMERMGELYSSCAAVLERAGAQNVFGPSVVPEVGAAKDTAMTLQTALRRWNASIDEFALHNFLQAQVDHWKEWDRQLETLAVQYKKRHQYGEQEEQLHQKIAKGKSKQSSSVKRLEKDLENLLAARKAYQANLVLGIERACSRFSTDLVNFGTKVIDVMSACGLGCAQAFQPIGTTVAGPPHTERNISADGDVVHGVVLHRPTPQRRDSNLYREPSEYTTRTVATS